MKKIAALGFVALGIIFLAGCGQKQANNNTPISEPQKQAQSAQIAPITENDTENQTVQKDDATQAKESLENFFLYLSTKNYNNAIKYLKLLDKNTPDTLQIANKLEESWENFESFSAIADKNDRAKLLEDYCSRWDTCLKAKIISSKKTSNAEYQITVQFTKSNGEAYPGNHQYPVRKIDNIWYVMRGPLYHP